MQSFSIRMSFQSLVTSQFSHLQLVSVPPPAEKQYFMAHEITTTLLFLKKQQHPISISLRMQQALCKFNG